MGNQEEQGSVEGEEAEGERLADEDLVGEELEVDGPLLGEDTAAKEKDET